MYSYRNLTTEQQNGVVEYRRQQRRPWHSPPHWNFEGERQFFISGTCFEHAHVIGASHERMTECENDLMEVCGNHASVIYAWCILPNHYHILAKTDRLKSCAKRSAGSTGVRHSNGTAKTSVAGVRSGIIPSTARSNLTAISGPPLITFITIRCITATLINGRIGPGRAPWISLRVWDVKRRRTSGANTRFWITGRNGT